MQTTANREEEIFLAACDSIGIRGYDKFNYLNSIDFIVVLGHPIVQYVKLKPDYPNYIKGSMMQKINLKEDCTYQKNKEMLLVKKTCTVGTHENVINVKLCRRIEVSFSFCA